MRRASGGIARKLDMFDPAYFRYNQIHNNRPKLRTKGPSRSVEPEIQTAYDWGEGWRHCVHRRVFPGINRG